MPRYVVGGVVTRVVANSFLVALDESEIPKISRSRDGTRPQRIGSDNQHPNRNISCITWQLKGRMVIVFTISRRVIDCGHLGFIIIVMVWDTGQRHVEN